MFEIYMYMHIHYKCVLHAMHGCALATVFQAVGDKVTLKVLFRVLQKVCIHVINKHFAYIFLSHVE